MLEDDDIKPIMLFLILMMIVGFLWGYVIGNNQKNVFKEEFKLLSAINSPIYVDTQILGNVFIKDGEIAEPETNTIYAYTTGYNSYEYQTDSTPCISASGDNICGRDNVVACPRSIPLGTWLKIDGKSYQCLDRLSEKYDDRIDIFFDKDIASALEWGIQYKEIIILD